MFTQQPVLLKPWAPRHREDVCLEKAWADQVQGVERPWLSSARGARARAEGSVLVAAGASRAAGVSCGLGRPLSPL